MSVKVLGNRVVVEVEKKETTTASGLVIAKTTDQGDIITGKIIYVGDGMKNENGISQPMDVYIGENVLFQYGTSIQLEGKSYLLVNGADIIAVI